MQPLLIVVGDAHPEPLPAAGASAFERRDLAELPPARSLDPRRPTVVLVDGAALTDRVAAPRLAGITERAALLARGAAWHPVPTPGGIGDRLAGYVRADASPAQLAIALRTAVHHAAALVAVHEAHEAAAANREALGELTRAGIALGTQRDPAALLSSILMQARRITGSDAGSIYLVEPDGVDPDDPRVLAFKLAQNASRPELPFAARTLPLDHTSVAGHAALTGEAVVLEDAYAPPPGAPYRVNGRFDDECGYLTRSMLVIPMRSQRDEVVGVLQLINRKRDPDARLATPADVAREVVPYDRRAVEHVTALAAQAAVSIENSLLHASIERLFDGFVAAAATAVEARDPTTYGHSRRVARLAVRLGEALDRGWGVGRYREARFTRDQMLALRYAALLHDFGKVAVREALLVKEKKLHPAALERITARLGGLADAARLGCEREKVALLRCPAARALPPGALDDELLALDAARDRRLAELEAVAAAVRAANDPAARDLPHPVLARAAATRYRDAAGAEQPLLTAEELRHLTIPRGNLDDEERAEVEGHVAHTYRFLQQIPWTAALASVPAIAHTHHEKPNGLGYPRRLAGEAIPLAARIIAVADVFDALTSADRPYKRAVPIPRALEMLRAEAAEGGLDPDLVETFVAAGLHEHARVSGAQVVIPPAPAAVAR